MALMLGALNDALLSAGADKDKAQKAAEEVAGYERELAGVKSDLNLLKWMVGFNSIVTLGVLWKVLTL
jgi:hypothetical protein